MFGVDSVLTLMPLLTARHARMSIRFDSARLVCPCRFRAQMGGQPWLACATAIAVVLTAGTQAGAQGIASVKANAERNRPDDTEGNEPLVPGFEIKGELPPVPGFGRNDTSWLYIVAVTEPDRREAKNTLSRYDRNFDGQLDQGEIERGRWRGDPMQHDRNRDGRLSFVELGVRYALRRRESEDNGDRSMQTRSRTSTAPPKNLATRQDRVTSRRNSQGSEPQAADRVEQITKFYNDLDANRNGMLEPAEYRESRSRSTIERRIREAGLDVNRPLRIDEFVGRRIEAEKQRIIDYYKGLDSDKDGSIEANEYRGNSSVERRIREAGFEVGHAVSVQQILNRRLQSSGFHKQVVDNRRSFRFLTPHERLPMEIPHWYRQKDANQDGQVQMWEFGTDGAWTEALVVEFNEFDADRDGIITPKECLAKLENKQEASSTKSADDRSRSENPLRYRPITNGAAK